MARPQLQFPHSVSVTDLYIPTFGPSIFLQQNRQTDQGNTYRNSSKTHECRNWDCSRAVPFLGIFVSNCRYGVFAVRQPGFHYSSRVRGLKL